MSNAWRNQERPDTFIRCNFLTIFNVDQRKLQKRKLAKRKKEKKREEKKKAPGDSKPT